MSDIKLFSYNSNQIEFITGHEFFNGTQMAKSCGKEVSNWLQNVQPAELAYALARKSNVSGIPGTAEWQGLQPSVKVKIAKANKYWGYIKIIQGGNNSSLQGTYLHKHIAIAFAQWCSAEFALQVSEWIEEVITTGKLILDSNEAVLFEQYKQSHQLLLEQESANVRGIPIAPRNEVDLAFRIKNWIDLCTDGGRFYIEHPLINTINAATKTRRVDFVKSNGRNVIVYELKLNKITTSDIAKTIGDKGYYQLCADKFNRPIKFIFLSPLGITNEAQLLLDRMNDVSFLTTQQLCQEYYVKGKKNKWRSSEWYLDAQVKDDKFSHLFTDEFIDDVTVKLTKVN